MLTFDRPELISRAIQSVVGQSLQAWELIVVDDGGKPRTAVVMEEWQRRDPRIRYFRRDRPGNIADATNFGLAQANGEYIAILDDDDYWAIPEKLERQVRFLDEHADYAGCGGGVIVVDQHGAESMRYLKPETSDAIRSRALVANPMAHSTAVYRRRLARQIGGYDETLAGFQDWDLWLRVGLHGKLYNFPEYLTYYSLWTGGGSYYQDRRNTRCAVQIVWRYRKLYPHFPSALTMALAYYVYARLPRLVKKYSFDHLSRAKKALFAQARPGAKRSRDGFRESSGSFRGTGPSG